MQVQTVYTSHSFRSSRAARLLKFINWSEGVIKYTGQYETCNLHLRNDNEHSFSSSFPAPFFFLHQTLDVVAWLGPELILKQLII
jgi:hypothetical protein